MCSELCVVTSIVFASASVVMVIFTTTTLLTAFVDLGVHRFHWETLDLSIKLGNRGLHVFGLSCV